MQNAEALINQFRDGISMQRKGESLEKAAEQSLFRVVTVAAQAVLKEFNRANSPYKIHMRDGYLGVCIDLNSIMWPKGNSEVAAVSINLKSVNGRKVNDNGEILEKEKTCARVERDLSRKLTRRLGLKRKTARMWFYYPSPD